MKPTQEERINEIKIHLKVVKFNMKSWKNTPKWALRYAEDVTYLMRELAKAQKPSV